MENNTTKIETAVDEHDLTFSRTERGLLVSIQDRGGGWCNEYPTLFIIPDELMKDILECGLSRPTSQGDGFGWLEAEINKLISGNAKEGTTVLINGRRGVEVTMVCSGADNEMNVFCCLSPEHTGLCYSNRTQNDFEPRTK